MGYIDGRLKGCGSSGGGTTPAATDGEIRFTIGTSAITDSINDINANVRITYCHVEITTTYPANTTITVGNTTTPDLIMKSTQNLPQAIAPQIFKVFQDTGWGGSDSVVRATISGSPGVGAGIIVVRYIKPFP